ncbi:methylsterol monooxygenase 1-1-like [Hordeum vulgare]|nr:methylsterol monooxygenase 1-1-like [Hordeum vulgare]
MLPYSTATEAEAALGRGMSYAERAWFGYSAGMPNYYLYCHIVPMLILVYTLSSVPLALFELGAPSIALRYKLQPRVQLSPAAFLRCYMDTMRILLVTIAPLHLVSYPPVKWGYDNIHRVHHEYTAPMALAAPYGHWSDVLILGAPSLVGPSIVPCHITTFWLWLVIRQIEAIDTHSGFKFPFNPTNYIPFYGGAEYHDYHHFVGEHSQSNFSSLFTFCDYLHGTDKGYRYHIAKLSEGITALIAKHHV